MSAYRYIYIHTYAENTHIHAERKKSKRDTHIQRYTPTIPVYTNGGDSVSDCDGVDGSVGGGAGEGLGEQARVALGSFSRASCSDTSWSDGSDSVSDCDGADDRVGGGAGEGLGEQARVASGSFSKWEV